MYEELEKRELLYKADGCQTFATNDEKHALMEWDEEAVCRLSYQLHIMLRSHTLSTSVVDRYGSRTLLVRRLEPIQVTVLAQANGTDTSITFIDAAGCPLEDAALTGIASGKRARFATMADVALHTARCLRAHLRPTGEQPLNLRLTFGIASHGETLLQAINPCECDLGDPDFESLCNRLGGDQM